MRRYPHRHATVFAQAPKSCRWPASSVRHGLLRVRFFGCRKFFARVRVFRPCPAMIRRSCVGDKWALVWPEGTSTSTLKAAWQSIEHSAERDAGKALSFRRSGPSPSVPYGCSGGSHAPTTVPMPGWVTPWLATPKRSGSCSSSTSRKLPRPRASGLARSRTRPAKETKPMEGVSSAGRVPPPRRPRVDPRHPRWPCTRRRLPAQATWPHA